MQIQINTDKNINGQDEFASSYSEKLESALSRFSDRITRLEVHLSDENSDKYGVDDKRCLIEARVKGLDPVTVSHKAENLDFALNGAAEKMKRSLETTFGKLNRKGQ